MERTMAGIRSDFSDLSASHERLTERVAAVEARVDAADSGSTGVRVEDSALRSKLSELTSRLSSILASRVLRDISISEIPASVTSPRTMVLKVFEAFGIPELAVDVLDVRCLNKKDGSVMGDRPESYCFQEASSNELYY